MMIDDIRIDFKTARFMFCVSYCNMFRTLTGDIRVSAERCFKTQRVVHVVNEAITELKYT